MNVPISDTIKEKLDIVEVVKDYLPALRKAGKNYKAPCPFHNEKTPSFTVSQEKQIYYCFGCNEGGDIFKFVMKMENLSFVETLKKLSQKAGLPWVEAEHHQLTAKDRERIELKKALTAAAEFYKNQLFSGNGEKARLYIGGRKLSKASVEHFGLGYAPYGEPSLCTELTRKGFSKHTILTAGLAAARENGELYDYFRNRIIFPIRGASGETIAFGGRALDDSQQPKYLNSPETPLFSKKRTLYGLSEALPQIRKEGRMLILEGYMDVIAAHQSGVAHAVAPLGTALSPDHAELIKRYAKEAILMFDADSAGINASVRASDIFLDAGLYVKIAELGESLDPDEYLNEYGREAFDAKLTQAADPLDFRMNTLMRGHTTPLSPQDKTKLIESLLDTVAKQPDEILKSEWIKNISARFEVPQDSVLRQLKKKSLYTQPGNRAEAAKPATPSPYQDLPAMEVSFLHLILKDPGLIDCAKDLNNNDFVSPVIAGIFDAIKTSAGENPAKTADRLTSQFPDCAALILKLSVEELDANANTPQNATKAAADIKKSALDRRRRALQSRINSLTITELEEYKKLAGLKAGEKNR